MSRKIIHCDADCFYAAVEIRDDPSLKGLPVAVGGSSKRRGVITTCSYEAREYGVRSAMSSAQALHLCPSLILLPHNMDKYKLASSQMREIFLQYTDLVEPLSLDEAYLDVSQCTEFQGSATRIANKIREQIAKKVGITVSAGVANTKFLAKIASDINKPNGICVIPPAEVQPFLAKLKVEKLHGVGKVTLKKMHNLGLFSCSDIKARSKIELTQHFGRFGQTLYSLSRGVDTREIKPNRERKSLSVEHTYSHDLTLAQERTDKIATLFVELKSRIKKLDANYVIIKPYAKIKFNDFSVVTVEKAGMPCQLTSYQTLIDEAVSRKQKPVRLMGIGVRLFNKRSEQNFRQLELFEYPS